MQRENRRLAAIVAADVAGYSRLVGQNEEATLRSLRSHRQELIDPLIDEHGGRIANTAGDSLLLEFQSVVDAVRCALAIQQGMTERNADSDPDRQIRFRVGINVGDVVAEGEDLLGDGVNIAARVESLANPGGIAISDDAYRQVRDRLDIAWQDGGEHEVKNIARPIRVWRWSDTLEASTVPANEPLPLPDKPSIAVLAFDNMSGDPEQEYFADGITEDIITALSRIRSFMVIARNSTFTYKKQSVDISQVGRELGARYVIEGSVRKAGDNVRITVQLIEAESNSHLGAERYDRVIDDIFALQDEIALSIVGAVQPELDEAERNRALRKPPDNLDAWDCVNRGIWHQLQMTEDGYTEGEALLRRACELDPNFAIAHARLAINLSSQVFFGFAERPEEKLAEALTAGLHAIEWDSNDAICHVGLATAYVGNDNWEAAATHYNRALSLNPSQAYAHTGFAVVLNSTDHYEDALCHIEMAIRLSPRDPQMWRSWLVKSATLYHLRRYEEAVEVAKSAIGQGRAIYMCWGFLAASLAQIGRLDEARVAVDDLLQRKPDATVSNFQSTAMRRSEKIAEHVRDGLRKAGLPE